MAEVVGTSRVRPGWLVVASLLGAACTGQIGEGETGIGGPGQGGDGKLDPRYTYGCSEAQRDLRGSSWNTTRRLSRKELENTVAALLGNLATDPELAGKLAGLPEDKTVIPGDFTATPPAALALTMAQVAKRGAELSLADDAFRDRWLAACPVGSNVTEACVRSFATSFGAKVLRRDPTTEEIDDYVGYWQENGADDEGLTYLTRRLLQAPQMVFHVEEGSAIMGGRLRLTDFEVASRVSYLTIDGPPDDALVAAARAGELSTVEGVKKHVARLLSTPAAREKIDDMFRYYAKLGIVSDPSAPAAKLLGIADVTGLGEEMRAEAFSFFDHVYFEQKGTFADLMSAPIAFPTSEALATVFGADAPSAKGVAAPDHPGLLHRPALLSSPHERTSPIVRGAHLRKLFLCDELGMPDPDLVKERQKTVGDIEEMSNRDRVTTLTNDGTCLGCHTLVNGLGFTFEGYDQLGATRTEETVFDAEGNVARTWPIDTAVIDPQIEETGPTSIASSRDLATSMEGSFKGRACFARRVFEYYRLADVAIDADSCSLAEAEAASHASTLADVVVAALANDDIFWTRDPQ